MPWNDATASAMTPAEGITYLSTTLTTAKAQLTAARSELRTVKSALKDATSRQTPPTQPQDGEGVGEDVPTMSMADV